MFEFHGWVNIQCTENHEEPFAQTEARQGELCNEIEFECNRVSWCNGIFRLHIGVNGQAHLLITACANHYDNTIVDFLYWLASKKSDSYGLVHMLNNDDIDEIKVWRIFKDRVDVFKDDILTPCFLEINNKQE